jgi:hypothetical protein
MSMTCNFAFLTRLSFSVSVSLSTGPGHSIEMWVTLWLS